MTDDHGKQTGTQKVNSECEKRYKGHCGKKGKHGLYKCVCWGNETVNGTNQWCSCQCLSYRHLHKDPRSATRATGWQHAAVCHHQRILPSNSHSSCLCQSYWKKTMWNKRTSIIKSCLRIYNILVFAAYPISQVYLKKKLDCKIF